MPDLQRAFERIPVDTVTGTLRTPGDIEVLDLSRTGLAFATAERLEEGVDYEVELRHREQPMTATIIVRWVRETDEGDGHRYRVGAEFVAVLSKSDTGIWDWVQAPGAAERTTGRT